MKKKVLKIVGGILVGVLFLVLAVYGYYKLCMDPYRGTVWEFGNSKSLDEMMSGEEAKEDLV